MEAVMEWTTPLSEQRRGPSPAWRRNLDWEPATTVSALRPTLDRLGTGAADSPPIARRRSFDMHWLGEAVRRGPDAYDINELSNIVGAVEEQLRGGQFSLLGAAISGLPLDLLSAHVLVAILRVASPARERIPRWTTSIAGVEASLLARGLDAQRLLRGVL
jgi:hypothetical protein